MLPFLFTKYFFPLSEPIVLSEFLGYKFDNPRTEKEIDYVYNRLNYMEENMNKIYKPYLNGMKNKFIKKYSEHDEYTKKFFDHEKKIKKEMSGLDKYDPSPIREIADSYFLAKICCIIRFNDDGEIAEKDKIYNAKKYEEEQGKDSLLDDNNPLVRKVKAVINYSHLLALLSHNEETYTGKDFIFRPKMHYWESNIFYDLSPNEFGDALFMLFGDIDEDIQENNNSWQLWKYGLNNLLESSSCLESLLKTQTNKYNNQLLYIGELLGIANQSHDKRIKLLMLTSIIELLVTHNPDFNRYNVEDSISKQFRLKSSILVYLSNKSKKGSEKKKCDINQLAEEFSEIYKYRANIAHGNFGEKDNKKKNNQNNNDNNNCDNLITNLYSYVRAILEEYLNDEQFVKFIKEK